MFRKNNRLGLICLVIGGCWSSAPPPADPLANKALLSAHRPDLLEVARAEVGVWDSGGGFHATEEIRLTQGQPFGWRLNLPCSGPLVNYEEEMILPAPGDWGTDPDMRVSYDGTTVTVHSTTSCADGWIEKRWSVAAADPPGLWSIRVTVAGYAPQMLHITFTLPP